MKITTGTVMQLLLEANPVPDDAFADASRDPQGQATLVAILDSSPATALPEGTDSPARGRPWLRVAASRRSRVAVPTAAITAALAAGVAITLLMISQPAPGSAPSQSQPPDGAVVALVANLTAHPPASAGDASAELRVLADAAAAQPAPAFGPVEYSSSENWGLDLGTIHYGLSYRSHDTNGEQDWMAPDGSSLSIRTYPDGKVPQGNIPVGRTGPSAPGAAAFRWYDPATLPASEPLMRQHLLEVSCPTGYCTNQAQSPGTAVNTIVTNAQTLMSSEPLPPAARAAMLRVLADTAASPGPHQAFFNLGSVDDRAGHKAVAIAFENQPAAPASGSVSGENCTTSPSGTVCSSGSSGGTAPGPSAQVPPEPPELWVLTFDPHTGVLLGVEYATCKGPVSSHLATGSCTPDSYAQYLEIKAVQAIPATPAAPTHTP
jgi:hypothetical protein